MKIVKWLSSAHSNKLGNALIEVEENEVSDVEEMLKLIDGDSVGHFGISIKLVGCPDMPKYEMGKGGVLYTQGQFGYDKASIMKNKKRYYEVLVSRD